MPQGTCSIEGCDRPAYGKGLCQAHYREQHHRQCSVEGCGEPHVAKGYCNAHYTAFRRYGDPLVSNRKVGRSVCTVDGCDRFVVSSGLCSLHNDRMRRHGTVDAPEKARRPRTPRPPLPCAEEGCDEPRLPTRRKRCAGHDEPVRLEALRRKGRAGRNWSNEVEEDDDGRLTLVATHDDGRVFRIHFDPQDRPLIESRVWRVNRRGYPTSGANRGGDGKVAWLHREILAMPDYDGSELVDHIDGDRLNARRSNLRVVSKPINSTNTKIVNNRGSSRYRGVSWSSSRKMWQGQVVIKRTWHHLGYFVTEEATAEAVADFRHSKGLPVGY